MHVDFYDLSSPFFLSLFSVENIHVYQTFKTVFNHISKHLKSTSILSAVHGISNFVLDVENVVKLGPLCLMSH